MTSNSNTPDNSATDPGTFFGVFNMPERQMAAERQPSAEQIEESREIDRFRVSREELADRVERQHVASVSAISLNLADNDPLSLRVYGSQHPETLALTEEELQRAA